MHYWTNDSGSAEVDFVIQTDGRIVPMEVKAETNLQAKSLKVYCGKYQPELAVRVSMAGYRKDDWLLNLPLWAVETVAERVRSDVREVSG